MRGVTRSRRDVLVAASPEDVPQMGHLAPLAVDVLSFDLSDDAPLDASTLDDRERERAARFRRPLDARRWIRCRAALRATLASRLGRLPSHLRFEQGRFGKPRLAGIDGDRLLFNVSHAADRAVLAVAEVTARAEPASILGIDIEQIVPVPELDAIARHHFAPEEVRALQQSSPGDRTTTFFRIWTRKEAFVKALGLGIGAPLERFAVSLAAGAAPLCRVDSLFGALADWRMWGWEPCAGYVAALAVRSADGPPRVRLVRSPEPAVGTVRERGVGGHGAVQPSSPVGDPDPGCARVSGSSSACSGASPSPAPRMDGGGYRPEVTCERPPFGSLG
jgi:4'-phosphopantetheinyl transferase